MIDKIQWGIARILIWCLARTAPDPKVYQQNQDTQMRGLAALYGTSAVHVYLDQREAYLIRSTAAAVLNGNQPDSKYFAGRLREVVELKDKLKAAHVYIKKTREALAEANRKR